MAIKIDQSNTDGLQPSKADRNGSSQNTNEASGSRPSANPTGKGDADSVRLTGDAQRAATVEKAIANTPSIDEGRIEAVRSAIQNGQYSIDAQRVADKILLLERDL